MSKVTTIGTDRWCDWDIEPYNYSLGGTPLDATLVAMRKFLPEFNKRYNVEKSILTVITDGFSHSSDVLRQDDAERKDVKVKLVMSGDTILRDTFLTHTQTRLSSMKTSLVTTTIQEMTLKNSESIRMVVCYL